MLQSRRRSCLGFNSTDILHGGLIAATPPNCAGLAAFAFVGKSHKHSSLRLSIRTGGDVVSPPCLASSWCNVILTVAVFLHVVYELKS